MSRSLLQKLRPYYIRKALRYLRHYGPKDFAVRVRERLTPDDVPYGPWLAEHSPDADALKAQRKEEFDGSVKFSVLVPVWNTPEIYFREMADSVLGQTYPHLELVIADASPENKELSSLLKIYEERDSRVKLVRLEKNGGIARNTNAGAAACLSATGYAGPASGPEDTSVGHVFLGCFYRGQTVVEEHRYLGERNEVRAQAMNDALRMLAAAVR